MPEFSQTSEASRSQAEARPPSPGPVNHPSLTAISTAEEDLRGNEASPASPEPVLPSRNWSDTVSNTIRQRVTQQRLDEPSRPSNANPRIQRRRDYVRKGMSSFPNEEIFHGPFVPYLPLRPRSFAFVSRGDSFAINENLLHPETPLIPPSTLDDYKCLIFRQQDDTDSGQDSLHALFTIIFNDTVSLTEILRISLQRIGQGTLDEEMMQKRLPLWRSLLHKCKFKLLDIDHRLGGFSDLAYKLGTSSVSTIGETQRILYAAAAQVDKASESLRMEMQIVDSRRSIAEAESVSKLTELAFVFIPLSFTASLFSMQVYELKNGAPLYIFIIIAISFTFIAYTLRLTVRSSLTIGLKDNVLGQIRDIEELSENEPIPTRIFLKGLIRIMGLPSLMFGLPSLLRMCVVIGMIIGAIISPIILLWLRDLDKGFSAVITVLLVLLEGILVVPVVNEISQWNEFRLDFAAWRDNIQEAQLEIRKKKTIRSSRMKKKRRGIAREDDPEVADIEE